MALSANFIQKIIQHQILLDDLSDEDLAQFCQAANLAYRAGNPIISDSDYDFIYLNALKQRLPQHPLLQSIEPEGQGFSEEKSKLPEAMLSIDKAYTWDEVHKWITRLKKTADEIGLAINLIQIKATPKLDGFAGFDDGTHLYTRGDGKKGSDISRVFTRGLQVYNASERGQGAGEIVIKKSYFAKHLAHNFENPRNFQASLIKEKALDEETQRAINKVAAVFVPFTQLPHWSGDIKALTAEFSSIVNAQLTAVDFDVDGVVFEVINPDLKTQMGANRKFHRWQIAFKENKDKAQVRVLSVTPQVGRTGKITPVAELEPTLLSGATIHRATGHHYGLVKSQGLGAGSVIELMRSGLVIPKINRVLTPAAVNIPKKCPSCGGKLLWESDFLLCLNRHQCPQQIIGKMEYFFKILANNDGFGIKTIEKLYAHGIRKISQIYVLKLAGFIKMGFGKKISENLINQLQRSREIQIEDWRFLAAFGVLRLGMGNCENLLKSYSFNDIFQLNLSKITNIDGFAGLSAQMIVDGLQSIKGEFDLLRSYDFNIETTILSQNTPAFTHALFAKKIVFTGAMSSTRDLMKKHAKSIGIKVMSSVNAKTDYLIIGDKVGANKIKTAEKLGVEILNESRYLSLIKN